MAIATTNLEAALTLGGEELKKNDSPSKRDLLLHYQYLRYRLKETSTNFMRKELTLKDVESSHIDDVTKVWIRSTLPIYRNKAKALVEKYKGAAKRSQSAIENTVNESWLMELIDICLCKCVITEKRMFRGKALRSRESRVCSLEIKFLLDQRSQGK